MPARYISGGYGRGGLQAGRGGSADSGETCPGPAQARNEAAARRPIDQSRPNRAYSFRGRPACTTNDRNRRRAPICPSEPLRFVVVLLLCTTTHTARRMFRGLPVKRFAQRPGGMGLGSGKPVARRAAMIDRGRQPLVSTACTTPCAAVGRFCRRDHAAYLDG